MKKKKKEHTTPQEDHEKQEEEHHVKQPHVDDETADVEEKEELTKKTEECEEWKKKCLYALAELENFRKRAAKERNELIRYGAREVFYDLLEILDNFSRAIEADKKESDPKVIVRGIEMIYDQLTKMLQRYEVVPIDAENSDFDPNVHDAMQQVPTADHKPGIVIQEIQKGYKYRDRILRPARVVVASEPDKQDEDKEP